MKAHVRNIFYKNLNDNYNQQVEEEDEDKQIEVMDILLNKMEKSNLKKFNDKQINNYAINSNELDLLQASFLDGSKENPFFVDKKRQGLKRLFLNSEPQNAHKITAEDFTTDSKIMGSLTLWQFTAIIIFILIIIGLTLVLIKKLKEFKQKITFTAVKHSQFKNCESNSVKLSSYLSSDYRQNNASNMCSNIYTTVDTDDINRSNKTNGYSLNTTNKIINNNNVEHHKSLPKFV